MRRRAGGTGVCLGMIHHVPVNVWSLPERMRWFLGVAWALILAKCVVVWWAIGHWQVPIHPAWVVGPTLVFAALATGLWIAYYRDRD